jgi:hypothetical protein
MLGVLLLALCIIAVWIAGLCFDRAERARVRAEREACMARHPSAQYQPDPYDNY